MNSIIIYGTGIIAEKFYYSYCKDYDILFCIDRRKREHFHGIECYSIEKAMGRLTEGLIVIASTRKSYQEIKSELMSHALREFRDFVWSYEFNKELCILYGNCHMWVLRAYFLQNYDFTKKYAIRIKTVHDDDLDQRVPNETELGVCTLFIAQDIREGNSVELPSTNELIKHLGNNSISIVIPNLFGVNLFFPQYNNSIKSTITTENHINNILPDYDSTKYYNDAREIGMMGCVDQNIYGIALKGGSVDNCIAMMTADSFYDHKTVKDIFLNQINKIIRREKKCDITISDFILEHYKNEQLFYDPEHPCENVICEKGRRILQLLGIRDNDNTLIPRMLNSTEIYIYDSVRKALGLSYRQEYIRIGKPNAVLTGMCMDRKNYVQQMLVWNFCGKKASSTFT